MNWQEKRVMAVIRDQYDKGQEFTTGDLWSQLQEHLKSFKIKKGRLYWVLKAMNEQGLIESRKVFIDGWGWGSNSYQFRWWLVGAE